jgi:hypothetical protein
VVRDTGKNVGVRAGSAPSRYNCAGCGPAIDAITGYLEHPGN